MKAWRAAAVVRRIDIEGAPSPAPPTPLFHYHKGKQANQKLSHTAGDPTHQWAMGWGGSVGQWEVGKVWVVSTLPFAPHHAATRLACPTPGWRCLGTATGSREDHAHGTSPGTPPTPAGILAISGQGSMLCTKVGGLLPLSSLMCVNSTVPYVSWPLCASYSLSPMSLSFLSLRLNYLPHVHLPLFSSWDRPFLTSKTPPVPGWVLRFTTYTASHTTPLRLLPCHLLCATQELRLKHGSGRPPCHCCHSL